jgi:hypothetical protein
MTPRIGPQQLTTPEAVLLVRPGHWSEHVDPVGQVSEHDPVHVTLQVDPEVQETFAPSPTVTSQVDP